jgi:hypothetical protein
MLTILRDIHNVSMTEKERAGPISAVQALEERLDAGGVYLAFVREILVGV